MAVLLVSIDGDVEREDVMEAVETDVPRVGGEGASF